jgi:hypothetical protein
MPTLDPCVQSKQKDSRDQHAKVCARPGCGKTFVGIAIKLYCSKSCTEKVWRENHPKPRQTQLYRRADNSSPLCTCKPGCKERLFWPGEKLTGIAIKCRNLRRRQNKAGKFLLTTEHDRQRANRNHERRRAAQAGD